MLGGTENNISGSFMLWRGAPMKNEWIEDYENHVGSSIKFKGFTSTSRSIQVALKFAFPTAEDDKIPVLFSISCSNYVGILGIKISNEGCSCYPDEDETVFMDGATVNIWSIERQVKIDNKHKGMEQYDGKELTCIHMFHAK